MEWLNLDIVKYINYLEINFLWILKYLGRFKLKRGI